MLPSTAGSALLTVHRLDGPTADIAQSESIPTSSAVAWMAMTFEFREIDHVPTWETPLDSFNRADGLVSDGAGSTLWPTLDLYGTAAHALRVYSNQLGVASKSFFTIASLFMLPNDPMDPLFDVVVAPALATVGNGQMKVFWGLNDVRIGAS